jgi:hypothetical protein
VTRRLLSPLAALALLVACLLAGSAHAQFPSGAVEHWKMDEASGNRAGARGAYTLTDGNTVASTTGKLNNAADFVAANSETLEATVTELNSATAATISAWVRRTNPATNTVAFGTRADVNNRFGFLAFTDGNVYVNLSGGGSAGGSVANPLTTNAFDHVVVVFNGSGATNAAKLKLYVNGTERTLSYFGTLPTQLSTNAAQGPFVCGREITTRYTTGQIDEVTIWARALSGAEVTALYNGGTALAFVNTPEITTNSPLRIDEGELTVTTMTATGDPTITWALTGGDTGVFSIDSETGLLEFITPGDVTGGAPSQSYTLDIQATNSGGSDEETFTIIVRDKPPNIITNWTDWVTWKNARIAWFETHCPLARAQTWYFANQGNDTTGDGSQGNPWQTRAKAIAVEAADSDGNAAYLFECGDVWYEDDNWATTRNNITVSSYGSGAKPFFNAFEKRYLDASNVWGSQSGNRWQVAETDDIAWLRLSDDRLGETRGTNLIRVADAATCASTSNSWVWVSNVLYVNLGGTDPNTVDLEAVKSNENNGIEFGGDGCRVEGIRGDGFGMHRTTTAPQDQPFTNRSTNEEANYFKNLEGYFSGSHVMAHNAPGVTVGVGGYSLWHTCTAGFPKYNAAGDNCFNFFSQEGEAEAWAVDCIAKYGTLKSSDWDYATNKSRGQGFFSHTGGVGLHHIQVMFNCSADNSHTPCSHLGGPTSSRDAAGSIANVRNFRVNCTFEEPTQAITQFPSSGLFESDTIIYGERYYVRARQNNPAALENVAKNDCWYVNSIIDCNMGSATDWALINITSNYSIHLWHTLIREQNTAGSWGFDYSVKFGGFGTGAGYAQNSSMVNSVFASSSSAQDVYLAFTNVAFNGTKGIGNNAYFNVDAAVGNERGFNTDASPVTLSVLPNLTHAPAGTGNRGSTSIPTFSHDIDGNPRSGAFPTPGPYARTNMLLRRLVLQAAQ